MVTSLLEDWKCIVANANFKEEYLKENTKSDNILDNDSNLKGVEKKEPTNDNKNKYHDSEIGID